MWDKERTEKLDPGRKLINECFSAVAPAYGAGVFLVDMEKAYALIRNMREEHGVHVRYLHLFIRACALALARFPEVRAMLDGDRRILYPSTVDIGVSAAGTTNYAPVVLLEDVDKKDLASLTREMKEGAEKARAEEQEFLKKIKILGWFLPFGWLRRWAIRFAFRFASVRRSIAGSFQISYLPEEILFIHRLNTSAMLAIGQVKERAAVVDGKVVPRRSVYFSLPIDHRVVDGKVPMLFAYEFIRLMENPELLLEGADPGSASG
jgi:2-oxoglutarate dehydrogenase E2 component (dihydrolipoamide succinyltransferase)